MMNCYCPRCGGKQNYRLDDYSSMMQSCPKCYRSVFIKMVKGEMIVRVKPDKADTLLKKAT